MTRDEDLVRLVLRYGSLNLYDALARLERAEKNAARWRTFRDADRGYTKEPLYNARTGAEVPGVKRWMIWVELPDAALLDAAIDAALAGEKAPAEALVGERREPLPCGCVEQCSIDNGLGLPPYPRCCRKRHVAAFVARQKPLPAELMPKDFSKLYDPPAEAPAGERCTCPEFGVSSACPLHGAGGELTCTCPRNCYSGGRVGRALDCPVHR